MAGSLNAPRLTLKNLRTVGGVTGWQRAAELAALHGFRMSSHIYPEVSAHLLATTPTGHWLEYVDWANAILVEPLRIVEGKAVAQSKLGNGLQWDESAVRRYAMS